VATKATGVGRGGRREGSGRPKGSWNRRSRLLLGRAKAQGLEMPLPRLLRRMNDRKLPENYRDTLAAMAAPYCHAKLSVVTKMKRPSQMSETELAEAITLAEEDALRAGLRKGHWPRTIQ
jgi:hypothetical protein